VTLKLPPGNVTTFRPGSQNPYNIPWSNVSRYEPAFSNAAKEFGVDVYLIIAVAILESGSLQSGERWDNYPEDGPSVGIMQVKPKVWQWLVPTADAYTPVGNIRLGTAALDWAIVDTGSWQKAIVTHYFPDDDPNGTTQNMYVQTITALMNEMSAEETPLPTDLIALVMGTPNYSLTFDWAAPESGNIYEYGRGHGLNGHQHTGLQPLLEQLSAARRAGETALGVRGAHPSVIQWEEEQVVLKYSTPTESDPLSTVTFTIRLFPLEHSLRQASRLPPSAA
jgi:hypothetical protein